MKPTFKEKAFAFIFVALATAAFISVSTKVMVGILGMCQ